MTTAAAAYEQTPALHLLPPTLRDRLLAHAVRQQYAFGDVIIRQDTPSDACYFIAEGRARVVRLLADGSEISLDLLGPDDGFGEIGVLRDSQRSATVRAASNLVVYRLERDDFRRAFRDEPDLAKLFSSLVEERVLHSFISQYTRFKQVSPAAMRELIRSLRPTRARAGEVIVEEGEPAGPLYIIVNGKVRICHVEGDREADLAYLRAGDFFGEYSMLYGQPRSATARAETDCALLALDPEPLDRIRREFPGFQEVISERIAEYSQGLDLRLPLDFCEAGKVADARATGQPEPEPPANEPAPEPWRVRWRRRIEGVPFIPQVDEADCGAAALAMACLWFGRHVSLAHIRRLSCTVCEGTSFNDLVRAARQLGLAARPCRYEARRLADLATPSILHWDGSHWVLLLGVRRGRVRIADPAKGKITVDMEEARSRWSGYAIELVYSPAFEAAPPAATPWDRLLPFLRPARGYLAMAAGFALLIGLLLLLVPHFASLTVDRVIIAGDVALLDTVIFGLGGVLTAILLLTIWQRRILASAAMRIDTALLSFMMDKMLSLPLSYFQDRRPAELLRRLEGVRGIRQFVIRDLVGSLLAVVQLVAFAAMMFWYGPLLGLLFLGIVVPLYAALFFLAGRVLQPAYARLQESEAQVRIWQTEVTRGVEAVKASGCEERFRRLAMRDFREATADQAQEQFNISLYDGTVAGVWMLLFIAELWLSARLVIAGDLSIGGMVALLVLLVLAYGPVQIASRFWANLQGCTTLIRRLEDLIEWPSEQSELDGEGRRAPSISGQVECRQVAYRYGGPDAPPVLGGITFSVAAGQRVALVGRNGAGKTTLIKCLATLLEPTGGSILFDGVAARGVNYADLRQHIGLVLRENYVFAGPIINNIAFGQANVDPAQVEYAADIAGLHEWIESLPQGYNTLVGEGGLALSPARTAALAIARALYRDPALLLFDDAFTAFAPDRAAALRQRLAYAAEGCTMIFSTQRWELTRDADLILVLDHGRLIEQGTHAELAARHGVYCELFGF